MLNHQKNAGQVKGSERMRRPERSMAVAIGRGLVNERHSYDPILAEGGVGRTKARLSKAAFGVGAEEATIDLSGIESTKSTPSYFSPSAENIGKPAADLPLLRLVQKEEHPNCLKTTFLGCMSDPQHLFIFKREGGCDITSFGWHFGLGHYLGSSILAWPVELRPLQGAASQQEVVFASGLVRPSVLPICSWDGIRAIAVAWRSWMWQWQNLPGVRGQVGPAVRLLVDGVEKDMKIVAAESAWWKLSVSTLHNLCGPLGIGVEAGSGLFDTVFSMTQAVLQTTDEQTLRIVSMRLPMMQTDAGDDLGEALCELDEAVKTLEPNDAEEVAKVKVQHGNKRSAYTTFCEHFRERRASVQKSAPATSVGKKKKQATRNAVAPRLRLPEDGRIPQSDGKRYMPPDSYLWKARSERSWRSRVPPFREVSRSWHKFGEDEALFFVVQDAWRKWCTLNGVEEHECPMLSGSVGSGVAASSSTERRASSARLCHFT